MDAFRHPRLRHEAPDSGLDPHQVSRGHTDPGRVARMQPHGVGVGDLVEPLGVGAAGVYLHREAKGRDQAHLVPVHVPRMHVASGVSRHGHLRPPPLRQRGRPELQPPRRRGKTPSHSAPHGHADPSSPLPISVERRHGHHVVGRRHRPPGERTPGRVHMQVAQLRFGHRRLVQRAHRPVDLERPATPHVLQRRNSLLGRPLRQPRHRVLEDPAVVLVHGDLLAGPLAGLEELAEAPRAVGVDPPSELDPELVLLPHLAGVGGTRVRHALPQALADRPQHRLTEADPPAVVLLVRGQVVTFRRMSHGQHVVGEEGGLVPRRRQSDVKADPRRVRQHLDPGEAVGVGPDGVVHPREVHVQAPVPLRRQVGQQERHLHQAQGVVARPGQVVPPLRMPRRHADGPGYVLVPRVGVGAAGNCDGPRERVQQKEAAGDLPSAQVARGGAPPVVRGEATSGLRDRLRHRADRGFGDAALRRRELEGVAVVEVFEDPLEGLEVGGLAGVVRLQVLSPVPPAFDEGGVVAPGADHVGGDGQKHGGLGARVGGEPVVGVGGGVGEARVEDDQLRAVRLPLHDPLRMRVEVVARLQVAADQ